MESRTETAEKKYKVYKNKLTNKLRQAKKEHYNTIIQENKNNIKGTWNILNSVMGNKCRTTDLPNYFIKDNKVIKNMNEVANEFNSFFVNVGPNLANDIIKNHGQTESGWTMENKVMQSMFLGDISENQIISVVAKTKNKMSADSDGIDMKIVKMTIDCISKPLCYIYNLSFKTGVFPDKMKTAKVIPLFKAGDKYSFNNYRPVSILPQFSKVLLKLFVQKLDHFIDKNNILSASQYGFRTNRSTALAVMEIMEEITTATDRRKYTIGVFTDLKKAFDTIDHSILFDKLNKYGVRGVVLNWLISYLHNRQQYVHFAGHTSECLKIECGVPQGSVLGPKLFILYINDICDISELLRFVLFADDTNFFCSGDNLKTLSKNIESEMVKLTTWFNVNKLSLNLEKTKFMVFAKRSKDIVSLSINGVNIEKVSEFKFLGVTLDENLTWKPHVSYVKKKVSKNIFILNKVKYVLDCKTMRMLYCSLIQPYLSYCAEVWGNTYMSNIMPLLLLQKRAIRIIHKVTFGEHTK